jgi:hypothetical protein
MAKKKKHKTKKRKLKFNIDLFPLNVILMAVSLTAIFYLGMSYMVYFHNVDLSYNMALMSNDLNDFLIDNDISTNIDYRNMEDRYSLNNTIRYSDAYIVSSEGMLFKLIQVIGASIFFGFTFCLNIIMYFEMKYKKKHK